MLQYALISLQRNGNSLGMPARQRAKWTKDIGFKTKDARKEEVDILWFIGDFVSFDPRVQAITIKVALTLQECGVDFGILYEAEHNSGNDARRVGEKVMFETLARQNIEYCRSSSWSAGVLVRTASRSRCFRSKIVA
ncbi:MAG TPA: hypothetical protein VND94_14525 [Terriglobia bacterium]|nr:hypothetical protein [Terriglobia bacterium]